MMDQPRSTVGGVIMRRHEAVETGGCVTLCCGMALCLARLPVRSTAAEPDAATIIQRSVVALRADWKVAPQYNYYERDVEDQGTRTYQVIMILGSPYQRLVAVNDMQLSDDDQKQEQDKLDRAIARRRRESGKETETRIAGYQRERRRDHRMIGELTRAFVFKLSGETVQDSHPVYILTATARPGYRPSDRETEVLTGMRGTLWIDKATFQWVRAEAEVVHPVSIEGFLARVEPGTRFELEKGPVPGGAWLPMHFTVQSKAKILSFIGHKTHAEETYFDYQKADQDAAALRNQSAGRVRAVFGLSSLVKYPGFSDSFGESPFTNQGWSHMELHALPSR